MTEREESPPQDLAHALQQRDAFTQQVARHLLLTRGGYSSGQDPRFLYAKSEQGTLLAHWSALHAGGTTRYTLEFTRQKARDLAVALLLWAEQDETVEELQTGS